jgi:hypothetical protein
MSPKQVFMPAMRSCAWRGFGGRRILQCSNWTCTGETSMSEFGPALGLYVLTAAFSILIALHWVA